MSAAPLALPAADAARYAAAEPYPWPFDGDLRPANTAIVISPLSPLSPPPPP